jgi:hypothetical protein
MFFQAGDHIAVAVASFGKNRGSGYGGGKKQTTEKRDYLNAHTGE